MAASPCGTRRARSSASSWRTTAAPATCRGDYQFVYTPHLSKSRLFETSGHLDWYADSMYPPMELDNGVYYPKPMNCPMHCLIYRSRQRSYRELPLRLFELGTVYRYERAGTLHGLMRIRGFTQDDSPHLLHGRAGRRGDPQPVGLRAVGAAFVRLRRLRGAPLDARPGQDHRQRGGLGDRHRAPAGRAREGGAAVHGAGGRGGLLRAEDRHRRPRRHRPQVAALHDPVRLQPARAVRPRVRRAPTTLATGR